MFIFLSRVFLFLSLLSFAISIYANDFLRLKNAYSDEILQVTKEKILWRDGSFLLIPKTNSTQLAHSLDHSTLNDQLSTPYPAGEKHWGKAPLADPGRSRYEPFFRKMYGQTEAEVMTHLETIYWLPHIFGKQYPLKVSKINGVSQKFQAISQELERLVQAKPQYRQFLSHPGGTFKWRTVAHTKRLSTHSFGMTIDLNPAFSDYWQWDLEAQHQLISEQTKLTYHNHIPWEIVAVFEKYGFIWGGKWQHYDTMHFEYRPELLMPA